MFEEPGPAGALDEQRHELPDPGLLEAAVCGGDGLGDDVVRHSLRHTAATWLMQAGVDMWEAAGWLGMTVEQLEANYGHHHPEFQEEAAEAFGGRR